MQLILSRIAAFIMSIFTLFSVLINPPKTEGIFGEKKAIEKVKFDEGNFQFKKFDIVVSPDGDDSNNGTLESPLKTVEAAKKKARA